MQKPRWRKFSEEKPEDGQLCLVKMKHGYIDGYYHAEGVESEFFHSYKFRNIEFFAQKWMPLSEFEEFFNE